MIAASFDHINLPVRKLQPDDCYKFRPHQSTSKNQRNPMIAPKFPSHQITSKQQCNLTIATVFWSIPIERHQTQFFSLPLSFSLISNVEMSRCFYCCHDDDPWRSLRKLIRIAWDTLETEVPNAPAPNCSAAKEAKWPRGVGFGHTIQCGVANFMLFITLHLAGMATVSQRAAGIIGHFYSSDLPPC